MLVKFNPRRFLIFCFILLSIGNIVLIYVSFNSPERVYDRAVGRLFESEMAADSLSLHYIVKEPEALGINSSRIKLPAYEKNAYLQAVIDIENVINTFSSIDKKSFRG